jgi:hypothetical protein
VIAPAGLAKYDCAEASGSARAMGWTRDRDNELDAVTAPHTAGPRSVGWHDVIVIFIVNDVCWTRDRDSETNAVTAPHTAGPRQVTTLLALLISPYRSTGGKLVSSPFIIMLYIVLDARPGQRAGCGRRPPHRRTQVCADASHPLMNPIHQPVGHD